MGILKRLKNLYFWSSISSQDAVENPRSFVQVAINKQEMQGKGYVIGLSEEEQSFKDSLNVDNRDTKIV